MLLNINHFLKTPEPPFPGLQTAPLNQILDAPMIPVTKVGSWDWSAKL